MLASCSPSLSPLRRLRAAGGAVLTAAAVALAAAVLVPALLGYERYVITSGSMTGAYDRGSLVYDRVVPTASLRVGDAITYDPPAGAGPSGLVTHRIVSIAAGPGGARAYRTKGDANAAPDPWTFSLTNATQARVAFDLPYIGYALAALSDRRLRMLIIGVPAMLVALSVLAALWRDTGAATAEAGRA
ncbi:MAG: signal peptidase [bacterium]